MSYIKTKIISTIGTATLDFQILQSLVDEGTDYIRINTSYGDKEQYHTILDNLSRIKTPREIKVIWDIKELNKLEYAQKHNIQTIALSFTEEKYQIEAVRKQIPNAFVISKIETARGVQNFDTILNASDGIMVARGDLGKAVTLEKVPPLQKEFTQKTVNKGKFLITATEMLLSMVDNPKPTRAEVSDVANAVFDHSSAVMLSEETAIGKHPIESVKMMRKIINEAEGWLAKQS